LRAGNEVAGKRLATRRHEAATAPFFFFTAPPFSMGIVLHPSSCATIHLSTVAVLESVCRTLESGYPSPTTPSAFYASSSLVCR
jgi:hypothetical protein